MLSTLHFFLTNSEICLFKDKESEAYGEVKELAQDHMGSDEALGLASLAFYQGSLLSWAVQTSDAFELARKLVRGTF